MKADFTELHACSAFSFLLGVSQPETMVRRAAELGCDAIAITDRTGFYGSAREMARHPVANARPLDGG